jgi:hypothetical protein
VKVLLRQRRKGAKVSSVSLCLCAFACACFSLLWTTFATQNTPARFGSPETLAIIKNPAIIESSGLVASRTTPGAYWTHNDSGDGPFIYALDTHGDSLGVFRVTGAQAVDWEDISIGPGPLPNKPYLYIGDIGDNDEVRSEVVVYRVAEPVLKAADRSSTNKRPVTTEPAEAIRLRYPDGKHNAEALMVHPTTGNIYIVTKVMIASPVVYEIAAPFNSGKPIMMRRIGEIRIPSVFGGMITGGNISPDGRRIALCDYFLGYELVLPRGETNFDEIWKQKMIDFDLGKRTQREAITYRLDGKAVLATSEGFPSPLIQVEIR